MKTNQIYFNGINWCRICPICKKELEYTGKLAKYNVKYSVKKPCSSCWQSGELHPNFGKSAYNRGVPMSDEQKKKLSIIKLGKKRTADSILKQKEYYKIHNHHNKGKPISEEQKLKISKSLKGRTSPFKGKKMTTEQRLRCSLSQIGNKHSDESKRKNRIASICHRKKMGITSTNIDKKSPLFFYLINILGEQHGYCFDKNYEIQQLGYFLDGYDKHNKIVLEYDSCYHERPKQKEKDKIRENEIIKFLKPNEFWRYSEKYNKPVCIYKG